MTSPSQTPREVVDALLRGRPASRMGTYEFIWADTLRNWLKEGYPADDKGQPLDPIEVFGHDIAGAGGWFDIMPLRGHSEVVEETDQWVVKRNGAGAALKWWKNKSGTPEHIDFRMTSREVWDRDYRPHLLTLDRKRIDIEGTRKRLQDTRAKGLWTYYGHLFIWENMRQSMGDVCLYESLLLDPAWIHDYNRVYTDFFKMHYKILFDEAGVPDGAWMFEDLGYCNGLFCSPKVLEELIFPYFTEMVEFFHSYNLPVVLHTCGSVGEALPMIVKAGFDGLNPMEVKAGNDPLKIADEYGDKLALIGGLDVRILETNDRDTIRRGVEHLVKGMKERGARFCLASDHSISTNVRYASYKYAMEVLRENWLY